MVFTCSHLHYGKMTGVNVKLDWKVDAKGYIASSIAVVPVESAHTSWTESSVPPQCFHSTRHVPYPHIYDRFKSFV